MREILTDLYLLGYKKGRLKQAQRTVDVDQAVHAVLVERGLPTASEAVYGFCGWITTKDHSVMAGATHDASVLAQLANDFCCTNMLPAPREDFSKFLIRPTVIKKIDDEKIQQCLDPLCTQPHYTQYAIQPVVFIAENKLGFLEGNVIKYVCRYNLKNGVEDLKKARHYLDMLIGQVDTGKVTP